MAFDFANTPTIGQQLTEPNGAVVQWDGVKWISVAGQLSSVTPTYNNVGRNLLHNSMFNVQQRGAGPWTANSNYTADRWLLLLVTDTASVSIAALVDADRTAIGDEAAQYALQNVFTGSAVANATNYISQRIENTRRLSGKTVTISLWARATSGTPKLGIGIWQTFGAGGSAGVVGPANATPALTTAWVRYSFSVAIPSAAGKTFGTAGTDYIQLSLVCSDQANAFGTGVGVQSGTVQIWGVQLEIGSTATPLEKIDPGEDLKRCQRFYCTGAFSMNGYAAALGIGYAYTMMTPVQMRAVPTCTTFNTSTTNVTANNVVSFGGAYGTTLQVLTQGAAVGGFIWQGNFTASADL